MRRWCSREELYEQVWTEPVSKVAPRYGISDVGLAKLCARANIPLPERGYWAKSRYGKTVKRSPLPPRSPGMSGSIFVGSSSHVWTDKEDESVAERTPPVFPDDIESLAASLSKRVGRSRVPSLDGPVHPVIGKIMEEEAARHAAQAKGFVYSWRRPRFEGAEKQRHLRIANALFLALDRLGAIPRAHSAVGDNEELQFGASVGSAWVPIVIMQASAPRRKKGAASASRLEVRVPVQGIPGCPEGVWRDGEVRVEKCVSAIAVGVIVAGELLYRAHERECYDRAVRFEQMRLEQERKDREEAERLERERLEKEAKARVDRLLDEANRFRQAADIRAYVASARRATALQHVAGSTDQFEAWAQWALAEADRIDPVVSREFLRHPRGDS